MRCTSEAEQVLQTAAAHDSAALLMLADILRKDGRNDEADKAASRAAAQAGKPSPAAPIPEAPPADATAVTELHPGAAVAHDALKSPGHDDLEHRPGLTSTRP